MAELSRTARNSKWDTLSKINLQYKFKNFFTFFFIAILLLIFIVFNSYFLEPKLNSLSFVFWFNIDVFDYYFSFIIWSIYFFWIFISNTIYSYFFFNNFSKISNSDLTANFIFKNVIKKNFLVDSSLPRGDWDQLLYLWLIKNKNNNIFVKNVFYGNSSFTKTRPTLDSLLRELYVTHFFTGKLLTDIRIFTTNNIKINFLSNFNNKPVSYYLFYILTTDVNFNFKNLINQQISPKNLILLNIFSQEKNYLFIKHNGFSFEHLNIFNNTEYLAQLVSNLLKTSSTIVKTNRWLFKYSIISRKFYKNTRKLTNFKSLASLPIFIEKSFNRNLWNTQFFTNFQNFYNFNLVSQFLTKNFISVNKINFDFRSINSNLLANNASSNFNFKFFEKSYFWLNKRFFFFNAFKNNNFINFLNFNDSKRPSLNFSKFKNSSYLNIFNIFFLKLNNDVLFNFENFNNRLRFKNSKKILNLNTQIIFKTPCSPTHLAFLNINFFSKTDYYFLNFINNHQIFYSFFNFHFVNEKNTTKAFKIKKSNFIKKNKSNLSFKSYKILLLSLESNTKTELWKNFVTLVSLNHIKSNF